MRGAEDPVDHSASEERMQVLRDVGAHPRPETCGHHDCSEIGRRHRRHGGWGARIRTWDHGTKTRCLTTWPRPRAWCTSLPSLHVLSPSGPGNGPSEPRSRVVRQLLLRAPCIVLGLEEAVDSRTCATHIDAKSS